MSPATESQPHPTRNALLEAGLQLAEDCGLSAMSINDIVVQAQVAKGTFYVHFKDRADYLVALHRNFHDSLKATILEVTDHLTPGLERLQCGSRAYLDGCLHGRAVKALLLEARTEPAITQEVQHRNADFVDLIQEDFAVLGWPQTRACARLFVAMCAEAALVELEVGREDPDIRAALFTFLQKP